MREGHACDWTFVDHDKGQERVLRGIVPPPLEKEPDYKQYDLVIFDSTGHGDLADDLGKHVPVIGDSGLASRLEDDRLFGIRIMEQCGVEVPPYAVFASPDEAKPFIKETGKRYVFKPFTPPNGEEQDCDTTYVSDGADDLLKSIDQVWKDAHRAPFLLQEVVEGTEISTEAYFDGHQFYFHNHTLEEKKFMPGGFGPNTGCAGNLVWLTNGPSRLFHHGLQKLQPFLRDAEYRGMIDLNTIVNEHHAYGLEWTPRFGYDASPSIFTLISSGLGDFLYQFAAATPASAPSFKTRATWAASERISIPPYPEDKLKAPRGLPVTGINLEDAWLNCYLYDVMLDKAVRTGELGLVTAGNEGMIACPIGAGFTPQAAWDSLKRLSKPVKIPNLQVRTDCQETTLKRLEEVRRMGWV